MKSNRAIVLACMFVLGCQKAPVSSPRVPYLAPKGELGLSARLRKLSLHLRGVTPELAEYAHLPMLASGEAADQFFAAKVKEYLASPQHIGKMIDRLDGLFRLKTFEWLPESLLEKLNAMDTVFASLAKQNLSWDTLLTTKTYTFPQVATFYEDRQFLETIEPALEDGGSLNDKTFTARFEASDPRVAGVITTDRFFKRYSTTNINRSRGRAAALFRIFLCDDMRAVVEPQAGEDDELLRRAFPQEKNGVVHSRKIPADEAKHGSDASCMACHYKLDPLGRTFLTSGSVLSDEASPGRLVSKRSSGEKVDIALRGIGDAAAAILLQPEYAKCQVGHFWKWFIDGENPPPAHRLSELVQAFEKVGRRTNDFVAYLVSQPEFFQDPHAAAPALSLTEVRPMLERCTTCHLGLDETIPDFTVFPIGGAEHVRWVEKIAQRLDLAHGGKGKTMPPKTSAWQPSSDDLERLKSWVAQGARDDRGEVSVPVDAAAGWLKP